MSVKISVCSPTIRPEGLKRTQECLAKQTFQDFEWLVEVGIPSRGPDLEAAYNRMIRRAKGELIVSLQDYIQIQDDGLEQFWKAYQADKKTFYTAPVGRTLDYKDITWDWRTIPEAKPDWRAWEIDWAAAPREALIEIGGFDEEMSAKYWTVGNVSVGCRADIAHYKFAHLPNNKAIAWDHNKVLEHPFNQIQDADAHNQRLDDFRMGLKLTLWP